MMAAAACAVPVQKNRGAEEEWHRVRETRRGLRGSKRRDGVDAPLGGESDRIKIWSDRVKNEFSGNKDKGLVKLKLGLGLAKRLLGKS